MLDCVGFECGDLAECDAALHVTLVSSAAAARAGDYCGRLLATEGESGYVRPGNVLTASTTQQTRIAFGIRLRAAVTAERMLALYLYGGSPTSAGVYLSLSPDGTLTLYQAGTALAVSSGANALSPGQWYFLELDIPAHTGAAAAYRVYVDGDTWISVSSTAPPAASTSFYAYVGSYVSLVGGTLDAYLDDLIVARLSGTAPVAAWGSAQCTPLLSATGNANVDDWPGANDGDTTAVALDIGSPPAGWSHATAVGQTPSGESILGVVAKVYARCDATTPDSGEGMQVGIESGGLGYTRLREWVGGIGGYTTGGYGASINPTSGLAWDEAGVDDFDLLAYRYNGGNPAFAARATAAALYLVCTGDIGQGGTEDPEGGAGADPSDNGGFFLCM